MRFFIFLLIPLISFGQSTVTFGQGKKMDELLEKSGKLRTRGINGFFFHQNSEQPKIKLMPPESLFKNSLIPESLLNKNKGTSVLQPQSILRPLSSYQQYVPYSVYISTIQDYNKRINDLSIQFTEFSTKTETVLDNLAEGSGRTKNFLDVLTKIIEILSGLFALGGGIFGLWKVIKKKKKD